MIRNKVDYKYYLAEDLKRYHLRFIDRFIFNENYHTVIYFKALRRLEYLTNIKKNIFQKIEYFYAFWNYKRLCFRYKMKIGINTCGPGLYIPHIGFLRVATKARVGKNCIIAPGVVIGTKHTFDNVATIGDNVEIALGAKIIGKVSIGNNVIIAPNSVVVKDIPDNCIVSGIPAKIIKKDGVKFNVNFS